MGTALVPSTSLEGDDRRVVDRALALRCVEGERAAQRALFTEHRRRVRMILHRLVGATDDIEDLSQDSFLEIFRSIRCYRGDARLGTWIDRITTRVAYRHISQQKRARALVRMGSVADAAPAADARVAARDAVRRFSALVDALVPSQRIAFTLQVIDGRSAREVASVTGASLVATRVHVWRARRAILREASTDQHLAELLGRSERAAKSSRGRGC